MAAFRFYHPTTAAWLDRCLLPLDRFTRGQLLVGTIVALAIIWIVFGVVASLVLR